MTPTSSSYALPTALTVAMHNSHVNTTSNNKQNNNDNTN